MSEYVTLAEPSQAILREKMSKFIAFAFPVTSAAEARARIDEIASRYHDARHVCWAYLLGADGSEFQSNDNGEPSGTAGRPILGQIRSAGLSNVAIAVVRYFGLPPNSPTRTRRSPENHSLRNDRHHFLIPLRGHE